MDIQDFNLQIESISGMKIQMDNLFNGDKRLGKQANTFHRQIQIYVLPSLHKSKYNT